MLKIVALFLSVLVGSNAFAMRYSNPAMISAQDGSTNESSAPIDASFITSGSLQGILTGTTVSGTLYLQGSNDPVAGIPTGTAGSSTPYLPIPAHWTYISGGTVFLNLAGATTGTVVAMVPFTNSSYRWLRANFLNASGASVAGTVSTITVNGFFVGF